MEPGWEVEGGTDWEVEGGTESVCAGAGSAGRCRMQVLEDTVDSDLGIVHVPGQ